MLRFGITERGEAGFDFSWEKRMDEVDAAIIISKQLNDALITRLVNHQKKVIFHLTCTGYGGTKVEPNVPKLETTLNQYYKLMEAGFPPSQVVLRLDPIIPTKKGIERAAEVLYAFTDTEILRVRYSFLDMYPHVINRFKEQGLPDPYNGSFKPSGVMVKDAMQLIDDFRKIYCHFESCAEGTKDQTGCISHMDLDMLRISGELEGNSGQRKGCLCPANKVELLSDAKRCKSQCLYCYWKD